LLHGYGIAARFVAENLEQVGKALAAAFLRERR
jgi:hypothetical protein